MKVDYLEKNKEVVILFIVIIVLTILVFAFLNKLDGNDDRNKNLVKNDCEVSILKLSDRENSYVFTDEEQETICLEWDKLSKEHVGNDEKFDAEFVVYINDEQFSMVCEQIVVKYDGKYILLNHNINEVLKRACYAGIGE